MGLSPAGPLAGLTVAATAGSLGQFGGGLIGEAVDPSRAAKIPKTASKLDSASRQSPEIQLAILQNTKKLISQEVSLSATDAQQALDLIDRASILTKKRLEIGRIQ